jgi:hypothetical protein
MNLDKVISFSVFGESPKYCIGMIRNLEISEILFPDWKIYIYYNDTVPEYYIESYKKFKNSKLIDMTSHSIPGMFWRFLPFDGVERFICRDSDSRLIERDKLAVEEWIQEDTDLHIMRDHPHHYYKILGGMWGLKVKENLSDLIEKYIADKDKNLFARMVDMDFLRDVIYPKYIGNSTVHISLAENKMENHGKPFPKKMEDFRFVGEIINEDESREYQYQEWIGKNENI